MDVGPLTAEQAIADTRHLIKEGFSIVTVEGAELEAIWSFLFNTAEECNSFMKSMDEIMILHQGGRIANDVIESIALNYKTVRYTFQTLAEAQKCCARSPTS